MLYFSKPAVGPCPDYILLWW